MGTVLILVNFLLLLFWIRLWADPGRAFYFNPFLSGPMRLVDAVVGALGLPARLTCMLILAFGLVFRAALAFHFGHPWPIVIGAIFPFAPRAAVFSQLLVFSVLDFLLFIARLWTAYVLIRLITPSNRADRATEAFAFAVRPFSLLAPPLRLALLAIAHLLIVWELTPYLDGNAIANIQSAVPPMPRVVLPDALAGLLKLGWMAAASFADGLNAMRAALVAFVIGGLAAAILQNPVLRQICHEGMNVILGRFARAPFAAGMMDFTPLIFFFALHLLYSAFSSVILTLIIMIS